MGSGCDVVIFDRYIYDEMANLPLTNPLTRLWVQIIRLIVPQPDLALLLDADPEEARARKPEYPVDFMHKCRKSYFDLARIVRIITAVPPLPLAEAKREVELLFREKIQCRRSPEGERQFPPPDSSKIHFASFQAKGPVKRLGLVMLAARKPIYSYLASSSRLRGHPKAEQHGAAVSGDSRRCRCWGGSRSLAGWGNYSAVVTTAHHIPSRPV